MGKIKLKKIDRNIKRSAGWNVNYTRPLLIIGMVIVLLIALAACAPETVVKQLTLDEEPEAAAIAALIPEPDAGAGNTAGTDSGGGDFAGALALESGNFWSAGIPGFGENALSAFVGEYRISGKTETVNIWLTMEFIYYEGWTNRDNVNGRAVREKTLDDGRVVALSLNEYWTAVARLPLGTTISDEEGNRIVSSLITRLSEFSGQNRNISLPALIAY